MNKNFEIIIIDKKNYYENTHKLVEYIENPF